MPKADNLTWIIIISSLIRLLVAWLVELGNDEVYYFTYALHLQGNYFDHPPGVGILIRLSTLNLWLQSELFVRLGAIVCAALGTFISFKIGNLIRNERTGLYAALLYNTSIYTSIIAGTFVLPDSPQVVFWLLGLWFMGKMVLGFQNEARIPLKDWIYFGVVCGCCIMCKVHGVFLWAGMGLYILLFKRKLFLQPSLYLAIFLTAIICSPILIWNWQNDFITWNYHSNRVDESTFKIKNFARTLLGQLLYNNPINVFLIFLALFKYRKRKYLEPGVRNIILCTGLPLIITTTLFSLFNSVLPHWSGPGFLTLTFLAAAYLDSITVVTQKAIPPILNTSLALIFLVVVGGVGIINYYPGTLGRKNIPKYGKGDFTLDMWGWQAFEQQFAQFLTQQKDSLNYNKLKIVSNKWFPAAHLEYYVARPLHTEVIGIGKLTDLHHFVWLNQYRSGLQKGHNALCIVPSNYPEDVQSTYQDYFSSVKLLHTFCVTRNGKPARYYSVYLLQNYLATDEANQLVN